MEEQGICILSNMHQPPEGSSRISTATPSSQPLLKVTTCTWSPLMREREAKSYSMAWCTFKLTKKCSFFTCFTRPF
jgi:hypothetical protein